MGNPILLFRLEGVLQSWGERSKWDYRDTADFPSKSGVIGLLACALGLERDDPEIARLNRELTMVVRADRPGELIVDYHTVRPMKLNVDFYADKTDMLLNAEGKKRIGSDTIVSRRSYLQDASFLVGISGEKALLEKLNDALAAPVWPIYLGRKSCVPSIPVFGKLTEDYRTLWEAMENEPLPARHADRILVEYDSTEGDGRLRADVTIGYRSFQNRRAAVRTITVKEEADDPDESKS